MSNNATGVGVSLGTARVAKSIVTGGANGLQNLGGTLESYRNNQLLGNTNNTVGAVTLVFPT